MAELWEDSFAARLTYAMGMRGHGKAAGLAAKIGVSESAISRWKGGHPIKLEHAIALRNALSVSLDWLLCGEGSFEIAAGENAGSPAPPLSSTAAREVIDFLSHFIP
jgi:transcriptional regulator with XRE-family HTH domain